jgi:L-lysine 2,3-aminomutase
MFLETWATFARGEAPSASSMSNHARYLLVLDQSLAPYAYLELSDITKDATKSVMVQFTPRKLKLLKENAMDSLTPQERSRSMIIYYRYGDYVVVACTSTC